ncbi:HIT family protein [Haloglycomyces albus]|uniref:HIT family protein n=1 Tax=Haloglycomyces albus TaxID=526067 RepID=UPI00046D9565|nr:HIT domain-containing protein [Haloglycomyces albus]
MTDENDDCFDRLWTPHRMAYIKGEGKPSGPRAQDGCPFCDISAVDDRSGLVVTRGKAMYVILNKYPYNSGHLMVIPFRHVADYTDLDSEEVTEMGELTQQAMRTVREVLGPHGFNLGINQGQIAGAGIAAHLHQHIVPRWGGDSNFMPVIARTKTIPEMLDDTRERLAAAWKTVG